MRVPPAESATRAAGLVAFYRATRYGVTLPDGTPASIRVGEPAPGMVGAWIGSMSCAWYLTACNPFSEPLPDTENDTRMAALQHDLTQSGCRFLSGIASIPGAPWREPSVLAAGLDAAAATALLDRHGQNAAVRVPRNGLATLWLQRGDWRDQLAPAPDLEWSPGRGFPS